MLKKVILKRFAIVTCVSLLAVSPLLLLIYKYEKQSVQDHIKYKVKFIYQDDKDDPYKNEREIAYRYYLDKYVQNNAEARNYTYLQKQYIGIDSYDLDCDGGKEILIHFAGKIGGCASTGCAFTILKKDNSVYRPLEFANSIYGLYLHEHEVAILDHQTHGYSDIVFLHKIDGDRIWKWQEKGYEYILKSKNVPNVPAPIHKLMPETLRGYKVDFTEEEGKRNQYVQERKIAYDYFLKVYPNDYKEEDERSIIKPTDIGVDVFDLNNDGQKEIFAYLFTDGFCGSAGCKLVILTKSGFFHYTPLMFITTYHELVVLDNISQNHNDLALPGRHGDWDIYVWTGKKYDYLFKVIP